MGELLHKLGVDWRLLIAQIVNFGILFMILRRVLYRPVLRVLEERRTRIAQGIADAEVSATRRRELEIERVQVLQTAEAERRSVLEAAAHEAEDLRKQRIAAVEQEAVALRERATADAARVRGELLDSVRREVGDLVLGIARKVTAEQLPASAHDALTRAATEELRGAKWSSR